MGRKPVGGTAMTPAERARRSRAKANALRPRCRVRWSHGARRYRDRRQRRKTGSERARGTHCLHTASRCACLAPRRHRGGCRADLRGRADGEGDRDRRGAATAPVAGRKLPALACTDHFVTH
jgi:hypothetical protein